MSARPAVSIVLAVHDQARWLPDTLASVQAQTFTDWELLVVDDGSTDDTPAIAERATRDPRIRHLPQERRERCVARNRGIAAAAADLIAFLDGDDLWHPTKLARQVDALAARPDAVLCSTIARYVDEQARALPLRRPPVAMTEVHIAALARANVIILSSVVARRSHLDACGGFDERLPAIGCEDWDLWLRLARRGPVIAVPDELTFYRVHPGNTDGSQVLAGGLHVLDKFYADPENARLVGLRHDSARARLLWYHAGSLAAADRTGALRLARRAFAAAPRTVLSRTALGALVRIVRPGALP